MDLLNPNPQRGIIPLVLNAHRDDAMRAAGMTEEEISTVNHMRRHAHDYRTCDLCAQLRDANDRSRATAMRAAQDGYARGYGDGRDRAISDIAGDSFPLI
jgi:hypothetical protein